MDNYEIINKELKKLYTRISILENELITLKERTFELELEALLNMRNEKEN